MVLTLWVSAACDDFLDVRPKSEKLERELFETAQGFEDAIYGVYSSLQSTSLYGMDLLWGVPEVLAQNLSCNSSAMDALSKYNYTGNSSLRLRFSNIWTSAYQSIGYANNILSQLEDKSPSQLPLYNYYKGEMLAVRALLHFDMLRLFAPTNQSSTAIPYSKTYSQDITPFSTVAETYNNIISDLKEAESLLSGDEQLIRYPHENTQYHEFLNYRETHFNLYAVQALLARVYWMKGDMASAAAYAVGISEVNAVMGRIVACPTAGSCGIVPAALYAAKMERNVSDEAIVNALFTAAGIGMVIDQNASIAGAAGGCQAECGTAAGMAAAALVELAGGLTEEPSKVLYGGPMMGLSMPDRNSLMVLTAVKDAISP